MKSTIILDYLKQKEKDKCLNCGNVEDVEYYWINSCNEEGEDYYEIFIDCKECAYELYSLSGWGEISSLDECLEALTD